jgi:CRP/FNR family cyclic AMP-dependent transcriptional regulator
MSRYRASDKTLNTMFKIDQVKDGVLKRFMIQIPAGTTLFKQNDRGNTLYVVIEGSVKLTHKVASVERVIATLGAGEIAGEKSLCSNIPYRRAFTAIAETDAVALEFDQQSLKTIAARIPDFTMKLMQVVVERLDRANALIGVLQTLNPVEKVGYYLMYLCEHESKSNSNGLHINVTAEKITTSTGVEVEVARNCLKELTTEKAMIPSELGFLVRDENALLQHLSTVKQKIAA